MKLLRAAYLLAVACALGQACTPQQQAAASAEAYKLEPVIFGSCGLVSEVFDVADPTAAPVVTIACAAAEDIDGAVAKLQSHGITQVRIICSALAPRIDGGA